MFVQTFGTVTWPVEFDLSFDGFISRRAHLRTRALTIGELMMMMTMGGGGGCGVDNVFGYQSILFGVCVCVYVCRVRDLATHLGMCSSWKCDFGINLRGREEENATINFNYTRCAHKSSKPSATAPFQHSQSSSFASLWSTNWYVFAF